MTFVLIFKRGIWGGYTYSYYDDCCATQNISPSFAGTRSPPDRCIHLLHFARFFVPVGLLNCPCKSDLSRPGTDLDGYAGHLPFFGGISGSGGVGQLVGNLVPALQGGNACPSILL